MAIVRRLWRLKLVVGIVGTLALYATALPSGWAYASTGQYRTTPERVPYTGVALVLGAGVRGSSPTPFLRRRLDLAAELYQRKKIKAILVSGDNSRRDYDEPTVMRDYLAFRGVPGWRIVLDYAGFDTWDSCVRAKRLFGVDRATVITQSFHLARAVSSCRAAGVEAWGVGDNSYTGPYKATTLSLYVREPFATIKASTDALTKPDPHFLGPQETGIQNALAN